MKIFSKRFKESIKRFVATLLIYSQLFYVAAYAAMPMPTNYASASSQWGNPIRPIAVPGLLPPVTPMESVNLNSQQFGLQGPLTGGVTYSDLTGTYFNGQYLFPVSDRFAFAALGEYGSNQYRYGGTLGYAFLPLSQLKFTAERFDQRLPFQFDSGNIRERIHQDAYGARFQQLFAHPFLQTVNAGGYYADAADKNLNPVVFTSNGANCGGFQAGIECINYRHIAGGISKGIDAGLEVLLTSSTLVAGNVYYDHVHYKTRFSNTFNENRDGIGAGVKVNQLFNDHFKLLGEATARKIYDTYQGGISWLPETKNMGLELALTGQHIVSHNNTPNNNSVSLQINWSPGNRAYTEHFDWKTKQLASVAQWVQTPAVHMNQVLAIAEQITRNLIPAITGVTPNSGPFAGGNLITISGYDFAQGAQVFFGSQIAPSTIVQSTSSLRVTVPSIASGPTPVVVDLRVQNPDGQQATLAEGYTYGMTLLPIIAQVKLGKGSAIGGSTVTITGKNFTRLTEVTFGGTAAQIVEQNVNEITVTTPAHETGVVDIVVTTEKGSATAEQSFLYVEEAVSSTEPIISSISIDSGSTIGGETVTISGEHFDKATAVSFGAVDASIVSQNSNEIIVTTPAHEKGVFDVIVTTENGTATASEAFTYTTKHLLFAPLISGLSPSSGPTGGGQTVTITGSGFVNGANFVFFGGSMASITSQSPTELQVTSPPGSGSVNVMVITSGVSSNTVSYQYNPPFIISVTPPSGPIAGGQLVTINGTDFANSGNIVNIGGTGATVVFENSSQIQFNTPAHSAGLVAVTVTSGGTPSNSGSYTYLAIPSITNVSPSSGPTGGGQTVTITGTSFVAGSSVTFNGAAGTNVIVDSGTQIRVDTPAGSAGAANVVVTTPGGSSNNGSYTYLSAPSITNVSPSSGPTGGGQTVTITGTGFVSGSVVTFNGAAGTNVIVDSGTQIRVDTPAGSAGAANVVVTTAGGSSNNGSYTYLNAPSITNVSPSSGPTGGGQTVTITGTSFISGSVVTFNGVAGTNVIVDSGTQIRVDTPAGSAGAANVVVTTAGGSSNNGSYTYLSAPSITNVSPSSGPTGGGQTVTVIGSNFAAGNTTVSFDGALGANVQVSSPTQLTVVTPAGPGAGGTVNVVATTPGGISNNGSYTYVAAPSLSIISPATGPASGGQSVTITGSHFIIGDTDVKFNGVSGTSVNVTSATQLTVITPVGLAGAASVIASTTAGGSSNALTYAYVGMPSIQSVMPTSGPVEGGQSVTIEGTNFVAGGTTVKFGSNLGSSVIVLSSTKLTVITPAGTAGIVNVQVATIGGSITAVNGYSYVSTPSEKPKTNQKAITAAYVGGATAAAVLGGTLFFAGGQGATSAAASATASQSASSTSVNNPVHQGNPIRNNRLFGKLKKFSFEKKLLAKSKVANPAKAQNVAEKKVVIAKKFNFRKYIPSIFNKSSGYNVAALKPVPSPTTNSKILNKKFTKKESVIAKKFSFREHITSVFGKSSANNVVALKSKSPPAKLKTENTKIIKNGSVVTKHLSLRDRIVSALDKSSKSNVAATIQKPMPMDKSAKNKSVVAQQEVPPNERSQFIWWEESNAQG